MVRVGLIGCGGMGNYHSETVAGLPNIEIVGVCVDLSEIG